MTTQFFDINTELRQNDDFSQKANYLSANLGTVYEFNNKHEAGFTFATRNYFDYEGETKSISQLFTNDILDKKTEADNLHTRNSSRYDASLNYKFKTDSLGSILKVFFDYTGHHMKDNYRFENFYNDSPTVDSAYNRRLPAVYDIYDVRLDYLPKFNKTTSLSSGGRYGYAEITDKVKNVDIH